MIKGFETTPMFGAQLFGSQMFSPQSNPFAQALFPQGTLAQNPFTQGMPQAFSPQALQAWTQGMGEIARTFVEYSKQAFEDGTATYQQLATAKSPQEAIEIQQHYAQRTMQDFVQQAQKISALYMRLAETAFLPQSLTFPRP